MFRVLEWVTRAIVYLSSDSTDPGWRIKMFKLATICQQIIWKMDFKIDLINRCTPGIDK